MKENNNKSEPKRKIIGPSTTRTYSKRFSQYASTFLIAMPVIVAIEERKRYSNYDEQEKI